MLAKVKELSIGEEKKINIKILVNKNKTVKLRIYHFCHKYIFDVAKCVSNIIQMPHQVPLSM